MILASTQALTEMSTSNLPAGKERPTRMALLQPVEGIILPIFTLPHRHR
jgi:hypothetical protein